MACTVNGEYALQCTSTTGLRTLHQAGMLDGEVRAMTAASEFTCKEMVEVITDYLDGALTPADRARFEAHLVGCRGCRAYLGQMRRTISLLGTLKPETEDPVSEETKRRLVDVFRAWQRS